MIRKYSLILAGISLAAWAQTNTPELPAPAHKAVVPLSADLELVMATRTLSGSSHQTTTGRYYRGADGRTRQDMGSGSLIVDGSGTVTMLNHTARQATVTSATARPTGQQPPAPPRVTPPQESAGLGIETIDGYQATGIRLVTTINLPHAVGVATTEVWTVPELGLPILTKNTTPQGEDTQRFRNVIVGEPDAALFTVPAGYDVKYVTGGAPPPTPPL